VLSSFCLKDEVDDEIAHSASVDEHDSGIIINRSHTSVSDCKSHHSNIGSDGSLRLMSHVLKSKSVSDELNVKVQGKRKATKVVSLGCPAMKLSIDSSSLVCTSNRKVTESDSGVMMDSSRSDCLYTDVDESKLSCDEMKKVGNKRQCFTKERPKKTSKSNPQHEEQISKNSEKKAVCKYSCLRIC